MKMCSLACEIPIPNKRNYRFKGIAFDGCHFFLTCPTTCEIIKFDKCFNEVSCCKTTRPYSCICYDYIEHCFWASNDRIANMLFKLSCSLIEIDSVSLPSQSCCGGIVSGVSKDCENGALLVAFGGCVISVNPCDPSDFQIVKKSCGVWNSSLTCVSPSFAVVEKTSGCKQSIVFYDGNLNLKASIDVPIGFNVDGLVYDPCDDKCVDVHTFYALTIKNGRYIFALKYEFDVGDFEISDCNNLVCENKPCPPPPCPSDVCADILESVALIETALSHILNAEGEKLQKIIACTDDIDEILRANKAINETVVNATHLEIILHDKLSRIKTFCDCCKCQDNCCEKTECCEAEKPCECGDVHFDLKDLNDIDKITEITANPSVVVPQNVEIVFDPIVAEETIPVAAEEKFVDKVIEPVVEIETAIPQVAVVQVEKTVENEPTPCDTAKPKAKKPRKSNSIKTKPAIIE